MRVEALYFAGARDMTGQTRETLDLPSSVRTVSAFLDWLVARYPELEPYAASLRVARNETFAAGTEPIAEDDVLAIIPLVAGG